VLLGRELPGGLGKCLAAGVVFPDEEQKAGGPAAQGKGREKTTFGGDRGTQRDVPANASGGGGRAHCIK